MSQRYVRFKMGSSDQQVSIAEQECHVDPLVHSLHRSYIV
jgi:hypothetical protein